MRKEPAKVVGYLALSAAALLLTTRRVARRQTDQFDRNWAARVGTGGGPADRISYLAQPRVGIVEAIAVALVPSLHRRERVAILVAPSFAGVVGHLLKLALPRERPGKARFSRTGDQSFPSTHSAHVAALALTTAYVAQGRGHGSWVLGAAVAAAATIGVSRLRVGAHWPTDVVAGWLVGLSSAQLARLFIVSE
jgi:membrane-associated phospholipid phosphatase